MRRRTKPSPYGFVPLWIMAAAWAGTVATRQAIAQTSGNPAVAPLTVSSPTPADHAAEAITVTGRRSAGAVLGDDKPITRIGPEEVRAYGVDTVSDLLTAISPETRSGRGTGTNPPVVLLNGQRISGNQELQDLPFEAVARVDIFTEEEALRYGYSADQRVVNIVTVRRFHSGRINLAAGQSTDGGAQTIAPSLSFTHLNGDRRINLSARYSANAWLRDSARGVVPPRAGGLYDNVGNLVAADGGSLDPGLDALAGRPVTVAGVPTLAEGESPALADFLPYADTPRSSTDSSAYTLQPRKHVGTLNGVLADRLFDEVSAALNLTYTHQDQESLQGPARGILDLPADNPFSPFATDTRLYRDFTEVSPLHQRARTDSGHAGLNANGRFGTWKWNANASYDHGVTVTRTETGLDLSTVQGLLDAGDDGLDPYVRFPGRYLGVRTRNSGRSVSSTGRVSFLLSGTVTHLPAGDLFGSVGLTGTLAAQNATSRIGGKTERGDIQRDVGNLHLNGDIPIFGEDFLPAAGKLGANVNGSVSRVSRFGTLGAVGGGLTWSPVDWVQFPFSYTTRRDAPTAAQLVSPTIQTPNVTTYDYVRGQSVQVTTLTGGNPDLTATRRRELSLGAIVNPPFLSDARLHVNYVRARTDNGVQSLPTATAAIENAFPDLYRRDQAGMLEIVDLRPVNVSRETRNEWNATFVYSRPFSSGANSRKGGRHEGKTDGKNDGGRIYLIATQVWRLKDDILLRPGLPALDLLNGGTIGASGGQPRHEATIQAGLYDQGFGVRLVGKWQSGTSAIASSAANSLFFSDLKTLNATVFVDLGRTPRGSGMPWAHNLRLSLAMVNLFNTRIRVRNGTGATPAGYAPAFMDPLGRTITLTLRKAL
ncbi:porin family protein [Gluconacetobacter liquefaciens]|uniref:TonB-dependent receptor n=2 Tax=Gluconacetobacter liquefaciens TaxID=89584 RepID=A0A7W4JI91_GLULI|nr:hypothetical protein [Gluconacetobacter liquefaciens]MBB2185275.1 hypothetical protein [Gluconacetobacter liquefaciens]